MKRKQGKQTKGVLKDSILSKILSNIVVVQTCERKGVDRVATRVNEDEQGEGQVRVRMKLRYGETRWMRPAFGGSRGRRVLNSQAHYGAVALRDRVSGLGEALLAKHLGRAAADHDQREHGRPYHQLSPNHKTLHQNYC